MEPRHRTCRRQVLLKEIVNIHHLCNSRRVVGKISSRVVLLMVLPLSRMVHHRKPRLHQTTVSHHHDRQQVIDALILWTNAAEMMAAIRAGTRVGIALQKALQEMPTVTATMAPLAATARSQDKARGHEKVKALSGLMTSTAEADTAAIVAATAMTGADIVAETEVARVSVEVIRGVKSMGGMGMSTLIPARLAVETACAMQVRTSESGEGVENHAA